MRFTRFRAAHATVSVRRALEQGFTTIPAGGAETVTAIRAGTLIDGKSATPRHGQIIVIRGNRIDNVGDAGTTKIPAPL